tara:strand:- start:8466 stop:8813 length:348 start_codon:yes stop_codon:yes gene_type:complete
MIVQKIRRQEPSTFDVAYKYYATLFAINGISLTEREIQLIAFIGVNGSISYKHVKEEFCKEFKTSIATINNMVSKLKTGEILIKEDGKIKLPHNIALDFNKDIVLQITLSHGKQV